MEENEKDLRKMLDADTDGMQTYEYIANNVDNCISMMPELIDNLHRVDSSGQFLCSTARFLAAVDRQQFEKYISMLISAAIDRDREKKYIGSLLSAIWGEDFQSRAEELRKSNDNFRRLYKRIYDHSII